MEIKEFLTEARNVNKNAFANGRVWKSEIFPLMEKELHTNHATKIRKKLRDIRKAMVQKVLQNEKDSEAKFLNFMKTFCVSETSCFQPQAILSGTILSQALNGNEDAKKEVEEAERALQIVEKFFNASMKKSK